MFSWHTAHGTRVDILSTWTTQDGEQSSERTTMCGTQYESDRRGSQDSQSLFSLHLIYLVYCSSRGRLASSGFPVGGSVVARPGVSLGDPTDYASPHRYVAVSRCRVQLGVRVLVSVPAGLSSVLVSANGCPGLGSESAALFHRREVSLSAGQRPYWPITTVPEVDR